MATSTVEDYLKCILTAQGGDAEKLVSMGEIASSLQVASGTVTAMMKTLSESGLVTYHPYAGVRLAPAGQKLATHVLRRHRLIELFLVQFMGLDWSEVHAEADRLEHAVSDRLIARMDELLGFPSSDPHGDPIPSADGDLVVVELESLVTCRLQTPLRVVRVSDQSSEFLRFVDSGGLAPGAEVEVADRSEAADHVVVATPSVERFTLGYRAAGKVFVEER